MHYTVTSNGSRYFEITDYRNQLIGKLEYTFWWPAKAKITVLDSYEYSALPTGFWRNSIGIFKNDLLYARLSPDWRGSLLWFFENGRSYVFKRKSIWNAMYILMDEDQREIAYISARFNWSKFNFDYQLEINSNMYDNEADLLLPFLLIYSIRHMRMRHAAA